MLSKCVACWVFYFFILSFTFLDSWKREKEEAVHAADALSHITQIRLYALWTGSKKKTKPYWLKVEVRSRQRTLKKTKTNNNNEGVLISGLSLCEERKSALKFWNIEHNLICLGSALECFVCTGNSTFQFGMSRICVSNGKYVKPLVKTFLKAVPWLSLNNNARLSDTFE